MHSEATRIERLTEAPDAAALAGGVPALEHDDRLLVMAMEALFQRQRTKLELR